MFGSSGLSPIVSKSIYGLNLAHIRAKTTVSSTKFILNNGPNKIAVNKQLNDKERVAAALENNALLAVLEECLEPAQNRTPPTL